jgi:superfamily II DNA or RNA helicase
MSNPTAAGETPLDARAWANKLNEAFRSRQAELVQLAEQAVRAYPHDPGLLELAAIAALLEERPEKSLRYLKRLEKHFVPDDREHLLRALALAQQGLLVRAAEILRQHGLDNYRRAYSWFTADPCLRPWLSQWLDRICTHELRNHTVSRKARQKVSTARQESKVPARSSIASPAGPPPATPQPGITVPELPRLQPSLAVDFELTNEKAIRLTQPHLNDEAWNWFRLRAEFARLSLLQGFDELLCLPQLHQVETYWYQVETVRKVLKYFRGRVLLADEVGLGKTIEAGMILKEYLLRGMVEKFLILTPASLVGQWQEEMATKFDIVCTTSYDPRLRIDPGAFWEQPRVIASIATARREEHFARLTEQTYDLVIVDEAHHLKNRTTLNYRLVDTLKKRFLLLLSATPVQNSLVELYNLLTLLKPGIFKTEKEFRNAYLTPGKPRVPTNRGRLRELMRDVMIRNTRALVDVRLPPRHATTLRLNPTTQESSCYQVLTGLVREVHHQTPSHHRLALHHLLSAAGSSPAAAVKAILRFAERQRDNTQWRSLASRYAGIGEGVKETALLEMLRRNPKEKKMVFVHHRETLDHLDRLLTQAKLSFACFEGSLSGPEKDAAIARFRDEVPVLLCTESGGEGRNVQFCNTLINFDLPWNPMAIEQRIGRVHRIGQQREVFIFNLVAEGTVESHVLQILDEKINLFELVVGEIDAILGELVEQHDFSEMVFNAWVETTEQERSSAFIRLGEQMLQARKRYEAIRELDDELFGDEFETA